MSVTPFALERTLDAPPERVWASFTDPDLLAQWFCPNPSLQVACELDVQPGGRWQAAMGPYVVRGRYLEVSAPERLAFTWGWEPEGGLSDPADSAQGEPETTVVVTLQPLGETGEASGVTPRTRLVLEHAEVVEGVGDDGHEGGWRVTLGRLQEQVSGVSPG